MYRSNCFVEAVRLRMSIPGSRLMVRLIHMKPHFYVSFAGSYMEFHSARQLSLPGTLWYSGRIRVITDRNGKSEIYKQGFKII